MDPRAAAKQIFSYRFAAMLKNFQPLGIGPASLKILRIISALKTISSYLNPAYRES